MVASLKDLVFHRVPNPSAVAFPGSPFAFCVVSTTSDVVSDTAELRDRRFPPLVAQSARRRQLRSPRPRFTRRSPIPTALDGKAARPAPGVGLKPGAQLSYWAGWQGSLAPRGDRKLHERVIFSRRCRRAEPDPGEVTREPCAFCGVSTASDAVQAPQNAGTAQLRSPRCPEPTSASASVAALSEGAVRPADRARRPAWTSHSEQ